MVDCALWQASAIMQNGECFVLVRVFSSAPSSFLAISLVRTDTTRFSTHPPALAHTRFSTHGQRISFWCSFGHNCAERCGSQCHPVSLHCFCLSGRETLLTATSVPQDRSPTEIPLLPDNLSRIFRNIYTLARIVVF